MAGIGFKDRAVARQLKEAVQAGILRFSSREVRTPREDFLPASKFLLAVPDGVITAASMDVVTGTVALGFGVANLVGRYDNGEFLPTEYAENIPVSDQVTVTGDPTTSAGEDPIYRDDCQQVRVWNAYESVINSADIGGCLRCPFYCGLPLLLLQQESNGDLYVVDVIEFENISTTVPPQFPGERNSCEGSCRNVWDNTAKVWNQTNQCSQTTTTTTTSTTTTTGDPNTTSTTPCLCPGSSTSTSTTNPCGCEWPKYCGTVEGECTYTNCSEVTNKPPYCSTTTSTTCDCNTSTTSGVGCNPDPTHWVCYLGVWMFVAPVPNAGPGCFYPEPPGPCTDCETADTYAIKFGIGGPLKCDGSCRWEWIAPWSTWIRVDPGIADARQCFTSDINLCACDPPSEDGTVDCEIRYTPCKNQPANPDPTCTGCYSTTTTTPNCNVRYCLHKAVPVSGGYVWATGFNNCAPPCPVCESPYPAPIESCQTIRTPCKEGTTTTTTTTTTSTSTSTTSTSCTPLVCVDSGPGTASCFLKCTGGIWVPTSTPDSSGLCPSCPPACPCCGWDDSFVWFCQGSPCTTEGQVISRSCVGDIGTSSTTAAPTTASPTTSAPGSTTAAPTTASPTTSPPGSTSTSSP